MDALEVVKNSLRWFRESGVMRPGDGFWGVAERLLLTEGNPALKQTLQNFPYHSQVAPGLIALEHRRADCNFQTALLFDLAAQALPDASAKETADMLIDFLFNRTSLQNIEVGRTHSGLWQFFQPTRAICCYTDDNSWVITILFILADRGRPELRRHAVTAARTLNQHVGKCLDEVARFGRSWQNGENIMAGMRLNPHWFGLATMALAHAERNDSQTRYRPTIERYYAEHALAGPPDYDARSRQAAAHGGLPWALSEYAYLSLCASIVAQATGLESARCAARQAADLLVQRQLPDGHFPAEHYEAPASPHLADLIYTQNFASLGLWHTAQVLGEARYAAAFQRSLEFLTQIQDRSENPHLRGCWRGMYDTRRGEWGGGDEFEGGQSSIYSGWTNAPIGLAFLLAYLNETLFVRGG